ncbi:MAG: hypothetical protein RBT62_10915 [Spirochaetia bacterium]|jgi:hypothetical protein|nr:hypothetical protein [Spirochaetia bacterium]
MKKCLNTVTVVSFTLHFLFSCASVEEVQTQAPVKEVALVQTPAPETVKVVQETPKPEPSPAPVAVVEKGPAVLVPIPEGRPLGITEEIEANNTVQTANYVDLGKSFTLRINPKGDNDWFRVFVQQQGYLQVQAKDAPKGLGLDIKYCTYDEWDGTKVIRDWSRIPDGCFVMPGEYYLCLNDDWNDSASDQAFSLRIGFLPEIDLGEPNNDPKTATSVTLGQTVYPAIYPRGDQDWYTVEVKKQGYIRLIPRDIPKGIGLEARFCIYDEWDGLKVIRDWSKLPTGCPVQSGVYHFCIGDDWSDSGVDKAFPMLIEFLDEMDLAEPNNVPKDAKAFLPGETKTMAVYPVGDLDYYSLQLAKAGTISLQAQEVPRGIGLKVSLLTPKDDDPSKYERIDGHKDLPTQYMLEAGKQYYLEFSDNWNDGSSADAFKVRMSLE